MKYNIYYMRPDWFPLGALGREPGGPGEIAKTHIYLRDVEIKKLSRRYALSEVFRQSQGEIWSPNGEARELIQSKGLAHTSMSVGDIMVAEDNIGYLVSFAGFKQFDPDQQAWVTL